MAKLVYLLCALNSIGCAAMLIRGYRRDRTRLLLWSSLCFAGLALNNVLLFVDLVMFPEINVNGALIRSILGASSGALLLYGLIWELT
jgi:hypothetical protein